jgi:plasmid stability protein
VKAAAARRVAEQEARDVMAKGVRTLGLPIDVDPGKALLDEIH